ncbi:hypothetical protein P154DRAFT_518104 [Amniculicola lignicola CBS 123094]|uniref:JmjC domain-containing histone demethylation protein 1 n=1 Tax=Amniculicola lignicola CBS 123094 TaxID=1392246 RepID=A0A6A5WVU7_9PLEO|nr:hypothetical protein P154DRAFT_518104 [Amniculicola lignicola CBS 123094]
MPITSFKSQYRLQSTRAATPPPPTYEPLSPILAPALPAGGKHQSLHHADNGLPGAGPRVPTHTGAVPAPLTLAYGFGSPSATHGPPPRSAPLPRSTAHNTQSHAHQPDTLPTAPISPYKTSPGYAEAARRRSYGLVSPATALPAVALNGRAPKHAYSDEPLYAHEERPAKRARSDMYSPPQYQQHYPRPATSHNPGWSYNVEKMIQDNAVRPSEEIEAKRISDAQLLLDFHNAFSLSHEAQAQGVPAKRYSTSHAEPPTGQPAQVVEATSVYIAPPFDNVHRTNRLLPPMNLSHAAEAPLPSSAPPQEGPLEPAVQTHTPPEEAGNTSPNEVAETRDEAHVEDKKSKKHQGWPKGKSRGSRAGPSGGKRKRPTPKPKAAPSSAASQVPDQLQSPQSLPADLPELTRSDEATAAPIETPFPFGGMTQIRRHSSSNISLLAAPSIDPFSSLLRAHSVPPDATMIFMPPVEEAPIPGTKSNALGETTICAGCHSSDSETLIGEGEQWINCDGCKEWFHFACAGFSTLREVRDIDKFYCAGCSPRFGNTTKVRKSTRAHTAVDYAGLNEGILKTSDDNPEHHYIQRFKDRDITFTSDTFARLPPELVTAEFFERCNGFKEPVVVPATLNPRPKASSRTTGGHSSTESKMGIDEPSEEQFTYEMVPDDGQDKIDMVIPEGLTVRQVAELYGPMEKVDVIDVKSQEGEDKHWNMSKWADYYEQKGEKRVRNVISLEVSYSKLGRLIRRPKAVRDLDLQDSIWPEDDRTPPPKVQFYCLMSVADCYTDFHIDFGGSSVYYHIIKGQKTFFFIAPTKQNLKKYEDWCLSPRQSHDFLGDQVKECYRVDLFPGDTMLIPSGWIHAVWTPEDSLVIGGNFLTRIHYGMQIKVAEIEKNTKVAKKFRYPFFQKIMWLVLLRYLEEDPVPGTVLDSLLNGGQFKRDVPIFCETNKFGHNSDLGVEFYNARYYAKAELDGLPDLANYIWRTVMISLGKIEGITQTTRNAVTRSIPKGHGDPLTLARRFAVWIAWKRGNESIPQWAHSDNAPQEVVEVGGEKKLSAAQLKRMERESTTDINAVRTRSSDTPALPTLPSLNAPVPSATQTSPVSQAPPVAPVPHTPQAVQLNRAQPQVQRAPPSYTITGMGFLRPVDQNRRFMTTPKTSQLGPKRIACDACRKRRIRCKHKDEVDPSSKTLGTGFGATNGAFPFDPTYARRASDGDFSLDPLSMPPAGPVHRPGPISIDLNTDALANKSGRVKACADCRKSKRRCIHDEYGNVDPIKAAEIPIPRGSTSKKRRVSEEGAESGTKAKSESVGEGGVMDGEERAHTPIESPTERKMNQGQFAEPMQVESPVQDEHAQDNIMADAPLHIDNDAVMSSIEDATGLDPGLIDPQLFTFEPRTPGPVDNGLNGTHPRLSSPFAAQTQSTSPRSSHVQVVAPETTSRTTPRSARLSSAGRRMSHTPRAPNAMSSTPKSTPGGKGRRDSKGSIKLEPGSAKKPEDVASLALALQLQMEEHGLRRRSK